MKTIVVNIDHPEMITPRLRLARELANAHRAHVIAAHSIPLVGMSAGDLYGGADSIAHLDDIYREEADKLRIITERELDDSDLTWEWSQRDGDSAAHLIEHSKLADLVLVGPTAPSDFKSVLPSPVAPAVVLHACAPVLVVPLDPPRYAPKAPIIVGWNGSTEAARVLKMSLPLLQAAEQVWVVYVHEDTDLVIPTPDIAAYLTRHGVQVRVSCEAPQGSIADTLQSLARQQGASMIMVGAYGRPRVVEYIFGGVSRALLKDPKLPIAMTH